RRRADALGEETGWHLEAGERAGEHRLHQAERGETEPELALPDRQHHVDQIGVNVLQRVRAAGDRHRPTFLLATAQRRSPRRSTKVALRKEITSSPFWFVPVVRSVISPKPGWLSEARVSATS